MSSGKKFSLVTFLLILLPIWLIGSAAFALVHYFKKEKSAIIASGKRFSQSVSSDLIGDDLGKIINIIGERNTAKPAKLSSTASMIQGLLGPSNTGFPIKLIEGPSDFQIIQVTVLSKNTEAAPIWLITSYDSPPGSRGAEKNASGLAATLATAQALANAGPARPIHFLFLPHANDPDSPVIETSTAASNLINAAPTPKAILCIEAMGSAETLILSSRDTEAIPEKEFKGLGKILGAEVTCLGDDFDLASTLFEMDFPALRIATRPTLLPGENDDKLPFPPTLAASTGRLIELVTRLAK
ncbi:MAG: hypothetical protein H7Y36_11215 [Armatimonadetes bacterium]|nr:hypothetical protein [Akkermansiaceae bacterium]